KRGGCQGTELIRKPGTPYAGWPDQDFQRIRRRFVGTRFACDAAASPYPRDPGMTIPIPNPQPELPPDLPIPPRPRPTSPEPNPLVPEIPRTDPKPLTPPPITVDPTTR